MMKKTSIKLLSVLAIILFIAVTPMVVLATNENVSVVKSQENEYIIYIKDYTDKKFKYAFTSIEKENLQQMDLFYINSIPDGLGNQTALLNLNAKTYEKLKSGTIYMWAKDENEKLILDGLQLDLKDVLTKENLDLVEKTTKRIQVEVAISKDIIDSTKPVREEDIDGVKETAKAGYLKITDNKDSKYYYQRVKTLDSVEYAKLMDLAEEMNQDYDKANMYEKVQLAEKFYSQYSKLINEADWQKVTDLTVKQPESTEQSNGVGDKYIVLLKKVDKDGITTTDAQFLQEYYDYEPNVKKEQIVTKETAKLPITYDSIVLIIVLAVVLIALVVVFIRMKKLNKKDETK